ncbi:hypothetical protein D9M68_784210 [compost metagenome]
MAETMRCAMNRPSPVLPLAGCICWKAPKMSMFRLMSMPIPVSLTAKLKTQARPSGRAVTDKVTTPSRVNLAALDSRFSSTCCMRFPSRPISRGIRSEGR